jgi:hypothetical protein
VNSQGHGSQVTQAWWVAHWVLFSQKIECLLRSVILWALGPSFFVPQSQVIYLFICSMGITSGNCLRSQSNNWSERQEAPGKAFWKWKVKVTPSREKRGLKQCSSRVQLLGVSLVLHGLSQACGKNLGVSAGRVREISRFDWQLDDNWFVIVHVSSNNSLIYSCMHELPAIFMKPYKGKQHKRLLQVTGGLNCTYHQNWLELLIAPPYFAGCRPQNWSTKSHRGISVGQGEVWI